MGKGVLRESKMEKAGEGVWTRGAQGLEIGVAVFAFAGGYVVPASRPLHF